MINGKEVWRTSLPSTGYFPVSCLYEDNKVYYGSNGKFFILDANTGKIIAINEMTGQGYNFLTFTTCKANKIILENNSTNFTEKGNNVMDMIFIAMNGNLTSLNKNNAQELWKLNYKSFFHTPASIIYDNGLIYVGQSGNVFCYDPVKREQLWKNELKSLGSGCVSLALSNEHLFLGANGYAVCLSRDYGNEIWRTSLPGTGYVSFVLYYENNHLYCAINGKFFILNPKNGTILNNNGMKDQGYGYFNLTSSNTEKKIVEISPINNNINNNINNINNPQIINNNFQVINNNNIQPSLKHKVT